MVERVSRIAGMALGWFLCVAVGVRLAPRALQESREVLAQVVQAVRDRVARLRPGRRRPRPEAEVGLTGRAGSPRGRTASRSRAREVGVGGAAGTGAARSRPHRPSAPSGTGGGSEGL